MNSEDRIRELEAKVAALEEVVKIKERKFIECGIADPESHCALNARIAALTTKIAALSRDLGMASTVMATASKIIGSSRPKCPDDLTESEKYELLMATARELLDGMVAALPPSPAEAVEPKLCETCGGKREVWKEDRSKLPTYKCWWEPCPKCAPDSSAGGAV